MAQNESWACLIVTPDASPDRISSSSYSRGVGATESEDVSPRLLAALWYTLLSLEKTLRYVHSSKWPRLSPGVAAAAFSGPQWSVGVAVKSGDDKLFLGFPVKKAARSTQARLSRSHSITHLGLWLLVDDKVTARLHGW